MTNFLFYFRTVQSSRGSQRVGDLTLLQIYHLFIFLTTVRLARSLMFVFKLDFSSFFLSISHLSIRYTIIVSPEPEEMDRIHSCVWKKFSVSFSFMLFFSFSFLFCVLFSGDILHGNEIEIAHSLFFMLLLLCLAQKSSIKIALLRSNQWFFSFFLGDDSSLFYNAKILYYSFFNKK